MTEQTASRLLQLEATLLAAASGLDDAARLCLEMPGLPPSVLEHVLLGGIRARRALVRIGPAAEVAAALLGAVPVPAAHAACDCEIEPPF